MNEDLLKTCRDNIKGQKTIITELEKEVEKCHLSQDDPHIKKQYEYLRKLQEEEIRLKKHKSEYGNVNLTHTDGTIPSFIQSELERSQKEADEKGLNKPYWEK